MRKFKLKTCLKIVFFANLIAVVVFVLKTGKSDENEEENVEETHSEEPYLRKFLLQRSTNDRENFFENSNAVKEMFEYGDSVLKNVVPIVFTKPIIAKEETFEGVVFKQVHKNLQHKLVHLDLKGAPPKLEYLKNLLPQLQKVGATGLLLEYEDMFPYEDNLKVISAENAYEANELKEFLAVAKSLDLEVIPLVQTFGHLEYVLKLNEFRELREVDAYPDSICPSKDRSLDIITDMINQIITFHSKVVDLKWIHLGCDEVYHIRQCPMCHSRNFTTRQIFVEHVKKVAQIAKKDHPQIVPLIWDDMLRAFKPNELIESGLGKLVEPVVWVYTTSIRALVPHRIWYMYAKAFPGIWIASAFKGASGDTNILPRLRKNYENNLAWLNFVTSYKVAGTKRLYNFRGIFLTGWSRYEHFSVICETLPVSIPSLILDLLLVNAYMTSKDPFAPAKYQMKSSDMHRVVFERWIENLNCRSKTPSPAKNNFGYLSDIEHRLGKCSFKESLFYEDIRQMMIIEGNALRFHLTNSFKNDGYLYYNVLHGSMNMFHHREVVEKAARFNRDLKTFTDRLKHHMKDFFDDHTIVELVEYKIRPLHDIFDRVLNASNHAKDIRVWKKRPFS